MPGDAKVLNVTGRVMIVMAGYIALDGLQVHAPSLYSTLYLALYFTLYLNDSCWLPEEQQCLSSTTCRLELEWVWSFCIRACPVMKKFVSGWQEIVRISVRLTVIKPGVAITYTVNSKA